MLLRRFARTVLLASSVLPFAPAPPATAGEPAPAAVGVARREFADPGRPNRPGTAARPIRVTLWYPAAGDRSAKPVDAFGEPGSVHPDAPLAAARTRYPLIVLSHGSGGRAAQVFWLGQALVERQVVVAAVDHNGDHGEELGLAGPTPTDFFAWERARDLSVALDRLLADPEWSPRLDPDRIGAAGFSLGGTTALWLAGARIDLAALRIGSPPPPAPLADAIGNLIALSQSHPVARASVARAPDSYRDPRVRAVFALAPPMGAGFTAAGLRDVTVPVSLVVGDADPIAPATGNAAHFAAHLHDARLHVLPGERGHYTRPVPPAQQRAELREVAELAAQFFAETLRPVPGATERARPAR